MTEERLEEIEGCLQQPTGDDETLARMKPMLADLLEDRKRLLAARNLAIEERERAQKREALFTVLGREGMRLMQALNGLQRVYAAVTRQQEDSDDDR